MRGIAANGPLLAKRLLPFFRFHLKSLYTTTTTTTVLLVVVCCCCLWYYCSHYLLLSRRLCLDNNFQFSAKNLDPSRFTGMIRNNVGVFCVRPRGRKLVRSTSSIYAADANTDAHAHQADVRRAPQLARALSKVILVWLNVVQQEQQLVLNNVPTGTKPAAFSATVWAGRPVR